MYLKINAIEKLLPFLIVIDYITGLFFFRYNLSLPFSQISKLIFIFIILAILAIKRTELLLVFFLTFCLFSFSSFSNYFINTKYNIILDLLYYLKIFIFPLSYMGFYAINKNRNNIDIKKSNLIFYFLLVSIGLTAFGFGENTYSYGVGFMGYFIAGNEISGLLLLVFSIFLFDKYLKNNSIIFLSFYILIIISVGIMILTKTALIGSFFVPILMLLFLFYYKMNNLKINKSIFKLIIYLFFLIFLSFVFISISNWAQKYIFELKTSIENVGGIVNFMFSGRNFRLDDSLNLFNSSRLFNYIFGFGWENSKEILKNFNVWGHVEIDFFDILISNGILGIVIIYSFWVYIVFRSLKQVILKRNFFAIPISISLLLLFINTFIAGHIVNSALLGVYLGYYSSLLNE